MIIAHTIPGLLEKRVCDSGDGIAHWTLDKSGNWQASTWKEYYATVSQLSVALREYGLAPGDHVGILAPTSQSWEYVQMAALNAGGVVVGIDPFDTEEHVNDIVDRAQISILFVKDSDFLAKLADTLLVRFKLIVIMTEVPEGLKSENQMFLSSLFKTASDKSDSALSEVNPKDPATIIFTSGTTGAPKGILYTHEQVCAACDSILNAFPDIDKHSVLVCWLPLSNLFQRIINFCAIGNGATTYFVENPREIIDHLSRINPHLFIAVPRFYEKLYSGMMQKVEQQPKIMRKLVDWAFTIGDTYMRAIREKRKPSLGLHLQYGILNSLVLKRLRQLMGVNLKYAISGSAPMPKWLLERYHAMGILILEAYGMSENIIPVAANRLNEYKFGSVGLPLQGNQVKVSEEGELLVKGPGVFSEYYGDAVNQILTSEGFLPSGDYAEIDNDGFITLTGRKSEIFKTSTGRRIAPAGIESVINQLPYVDHAVVFGANKKYLIALLAIDPLWISKQIENERSIDKVNEISTYMQQIIKNDLVERVLALPSYQRPAGLLLLSRPFSIEGNELTANLKLRRKSIVAKYQEQIDDFYVALDEYYAEQPNKSKSKLDMMVWNI